jgi:RimJ/RimL family protein N-acetyltransferase
MTLPRSVTCHPVHLRPLRESDAAALCAAYGAGQDDDVDPARTPEEALALIFAYASELGSGSRLVYGIFCDRELVGTGAVTAADARAMNVGLWLSQSARGRGFGTAAVIALTEIAIRCVGADRAEIWCSPENAAMIRIAERAGYEYVATLPRWMLRANGERFDQCVWRLDARAWTSRADIRVAHEPPESDSWRVWSAVASHLRTQYAVAEERAYYCELAVPVSMHGASHWQSVCVEQSRAAAEEWLVLRAPVGGETMFSHTAAIHHNARLVAGALAVEDGFHVLRYGVSPSVITTDGIDRIVRILADEAVNLRTAFVATPLHHFHAFSEFAD